jgi:2,6-dihydroxypyridine 3-monooxygenase
MVPGGHGLECNGPTVAVVGGSIGGLISALVLRDAGCDVQVFERSRTPLEGRGAGIVLHPVTVRYLEAARSLDLERVAAPAAVLRYLTRAGDVLLEEPIRYLFTSYATLYAALLERLEPERYHLGAECIGLDQRHDRVVVRLAEGGDRSFDLVVGADGIRSTVRALLFPEIAPTYAGYVGWRGTLPEADLPPRAAEGLLGALTYFVAPGTHVLSYSIPATERAGSERLTNWVWYRNVAEGGPIEDLMTDASGVRHDMSLPVGSVRPEHVSALHGTARDVLPPAFADLVAASPEPFVQVIVDIGVPAMSSGRVCLLGDAAFALRPHIAAGTAKAAADAHALGEAIVASGGDVPRALAEWEPSQIELGRRALERARRVGARVQIDGTYRPGDPEMAFGLFAPGDQNFPRLEPATGGRA